jgi:redox-sensing transcriptional repressor
MLFDSDIEKIGQTVNNLEVFGMDGIKDKVRQNKVKIAILAVPASDAQTVADQLVKAGVKAILNYAPINLNVPNDVHVQHIDPATHLQRMTYYL